jgi:hypothetical protein
MQSRLQDPATEVRLGTPDIVVIHVGATAIRARAAPEPQPARSSNRVVGSHATPIGSNLVRLLANFDRQLSPELGGRSRLSLTESALMPVGPTWICQAVARATPSTRTRGGGSMPALIRSTRAAGNCRNASEIGRDRHGGRDRPARAIGPAAAARVLSARFPERCPTYHWRRPGRHIHQHEHVTPRHIRAPRRTRGDRAAGTSTGSESQATVIPRSSMGGEEIKKKSP